MGVGLTIAATSSYGKSTHSSAKKHVLVAAKHSKKSSSSHSSKHSKTSSKLIKVKGIKKISKKHSTRKSARHRHTFIAKKHHQETPSPLEKMLPPMADLETASHEADTIERFAEDPIPTPTSSNPRIHKIIMVGNKLSLIEEPSADETSHHFRSAHGIINSSLAEAGADIGLSDDLIQQLTDIFAWDVDFAASLQRGDQFTVVYENNLNADPLIVAAEFVNQGRILTAVRYQDEYGNSNYYTPEGKAMRKAFLSTPVEFARVSSHFNINRKHPILNRIRAHKGVDYAARIGTPVKSTGDGTIAFLGHKGGYGQVVIIQHGERYETVYAHLSKFKRDLQAGDPIKQGEIIGYVGQTGLATGPHLHYEFRVDGVHKNPETLQASSRQALTLDNRYMVDFKQQAQPLLAELYHTKAQNLLARNQIKVE